ncbi:MAG: ABC transporter, partial [Gemmobacter sp.]
MRALWNIFVLVLRDQRRALLRGALLGLAVLLMGVGLLGLSGWFITAAAAAGLAGLGAVFDVFRPSAMVRLLALSRAAARYGERLLTHDATLLALETLRLRLLAAQLVAPYGRMVRLRGAQALNRLTADVDALDGVSLRLILPLLSGMLAQGIVFAGLWVFVGLKIALWVLLACLAGAAVILALAARRAVPLSRRAEQAAQACRSRLVDMIRARRDLATHGRLAAQAALVQEAERRRAANRHRLDRIERRAGAVVSALMVLVVAGALGLGITAVQSGDLAPAFAALAVFAALALGETLHPLRRAVADLGRMAEAARRVQRDLQGGAPLAVPTPVVAAGSGLQLR